MTYKVAVLMGSPNDAAKMQPAVETLAQFGLDPEMQAMSAHRNPDEVAEFVRNARSRGYVAIICAAGMAAHRRLRKARQIGIGDRHALHRMGQMAKAGPKDQPKANGVCPRPRADGGQRLSVP